MTGSKISRTTSFAKKACPAQNLFETAPIAKTAFKKADSPSRGSTMVQRDQPKPVFRPSPSLARDAEREAFNSRWQMERESADREARKAKFKAKRNGQHLKRTFNRARG